MIVVRDVSSLRPTGRACAISLGYFDGIHLGHQSVLNRLVQVARNHAGAAIVLGAVDRNCPALGCLRQRTAHLAALGIDALWLMRSWRETRRRAGEVLAALPRDLSVQALVVGATDVAAVTPVSRDRGMPIEAVSMVAVDGEVVTSAAVRSLVAAGNLKGAERMLGRAYAVGGRIIHGLHRGRELGFPTANMRITGLQLPPNGVYAVRFRAGSRVCDGVANLGFNPTFANMERSLETHVFDFDGDLYGSYAEVTFVAYLRGERKFSGVGGLIEQIRIDCADARRLLS